MPINSRSDGSPRFVARLLGYLVGEVSVDAETRARIDEHLGALHLLLDPDEGRRLVAEARLELVQLFGNASAEDDDLKLDRECLVALSVVGFEASPPPQEVSGTISMRGILEARRDPDSGEVLSWVEMRTACEGPTKAAGVMLGRLVGKLSYFPVRGPSLLVGASPRSVDKCAKAFEDPEIPPMAHPPVSAFKSFLRVMRVNLEPYTKRFVQAGEEDWASMARIDDEGNYIPARARDE